ncbi:hypothetical protein PFLmoz3_01300 [Pseudomonas fluorescens]|uniref:Uncharacterized protein n=1 Tax=Pseudomonas fluorescens TaxID=294 RepID=A0A109LJ38_PSEFL|nr:hypothetical protein PFLmoz3_01300 [Pseudomonas fluorescens]
MLAPSTRRRRLKRSGELPAVRSDCSSRRNQAHGPSRVIPERPLADGGMMEIRTTPMLPGFGHCIATGRLGPWS